jgi:sugar/nucleoside kinase (ribokinase family)
LEFSIGGNAANNAVGVSRLGINVSIVLSVGEDDIGSQIKSHLEKEQVDTKFVVQQAGTRSNYSTIVNYGGERTIFVYHAPRTYEFPKDLPATHWVYLTSMGESFKPFYDETLAWLKENPEILLAFNPGSYQLRAGVEVMKPVLSRTYVIFVNRQEAEKITGTTESTSGRERELLKALSAMGPKVCVITDGGNGSFIYDGKRFVKAGVLPIDAYERTGAGDAFGSGCLAALIKGKTLEDALLWGTLNSASKIGFVGSQKGLLREEEMPIWIDRAKSSNVSVEEF